MPNYIDTEFEGIKLSMNKLTYDIFPFNETYDTFPVHYCGAGRGIPELVVPDYIFGATRFLRLIGLDFSIKIAIGCKIHDDDWFFADPTIEEFDCANKRLRSNLDNIIEAKARNEWIQARALYRSVTYKNAVSIHGKNVFWSIKKAQGHEIPVLEHASITEEVFNIVKKEIGEMR